MNDRRIDNLASQGRPRPAIGAITVDVEAWFHAHNLRIQRQEWTRLPARLNRPIDEILALLDRYQTRATFFVLGWIAGRLPKLVRRIHQAGHEIASHGYWHQRVSEQTPLQFRRDVYTAKAVLEDLIGGDVCGYRAPSYSIGRDTSWALDVLDELGFRYDSSIYPARAPHGRYGTFRSPLRPHRVSGTLWEFPLPTWRVLGRRVPAATGGYLRILPWTVTRRAIDQNVATDVPVVVNVHPWELDPEQPRRQVPLWNRTLHYTGLGTTKVKLERLLQTYRFTSLAELHARYAAEAVSRVQSARRREVLRSAAKGLASAPTAERTLPNRARTPQGSSRFDEVR